MKKRYAVIMTAAMMTGIMAATVLAEGPGMDGGQQMSGPQMPGGNEMGQPPQMNSEAPQGEAFQPDGNEQMPEMNGEAPQMDQNSQSPQMNGQQPPQGEAPAETGNGQAPEMNGEAPQGEAPASDENGQAPEMNGEVPQTGENGQAPQMGENGQPPQMNGKGPEDDFGFIEFKNYVEDGTISQETYDAITKYMEENKPELPEGMKEGERPELPEGAVEGERPELPEGAKDGERPEMKEGEGPDLLKDLLEAGVITQEEYDTLAAAREANRPAMPAANQNNENTQATDESTGA